MLYGQLPLAPPSVPHNHLDLTESTRDGSAFATSTKQPLPDSLGYPLLSSGTLKTAYDLAKLQYEIQRKTIHQSFPIGSEEHAQTKLAFLSQLHALQLSMPTKSGDTNPSSQLPYMRLIHIPFPLLFNFLELFL